MNKFISTLIILFFSTVAYSKVIDITNYGALGNSKKNNQNEFERAILDLRNDDSLYIPKGKFLINHLIIKNLANLTIFGEGVLISSGKGNKYFVEIQNCKGIKIYGLTFDGKNSKNIGLDIYNSAGGILSNVLLQNFKGIDKDWSAALRLRKDNSNFTISKVTAKDISSQNNAAIGFYVMSYENESFSKNLIIDQCLIKNIDSPEDADGIKIQQIGRSSFIKIKNSKFSNTRKRAIKVQTSDVEIINNLVIRTERFGNGFSVFSVYGNNVDIIDNKFNAEGNSSVNMFVDISAMSNVRILNNTHHNSVTSSTSVRDFVVTKYHSNEKSFITNNLEIIGNTAENIRNFLRISSNSYSLKVANNDVRGLESNFILINDDKKVNSVNINRFNNSIHYKKFKYNEVYVPKKVKLLDNNR